MCAPAHLRLRILELVDDLVFVFGGGWNARALERRRGYQHLVDSALRCRSLSSSAISLVKRRLRVPTRFIQDMLN